MLNFNKILHSKQIIHLLALTLFFLAGIYLTFPLIFHMGNMATGYGDELVNAWIQNWVIHALYMNPLSVFEANIYYPYHDTLLFSETFITSSILAIPVRMLIGQPVATENFTLISSLTILGFSLYLLSYYLTKNFFASLLSGILVIFSPAALSNYTQIQMLDIGWAVFSILFFIVFIKSKKSRYLGISLFFFLFQSYNSILPGYFIVFSYVVFLLYYWFFDNKHFQNLITTKNILLLILTLILLSPLAITYYSISNQFHYVRDIRDTIHFALQPEDLLYGSYFTHFSNYLTSLPFNKYSQNNEFKPGYLGFVFTLLSIFAFYYFIRNIKNKKYFFINIFSIIALVGLVLSFGPFLHINRHTIHKPFPIPLPYFFFYYLVPGFKGIRNSHMWEMLFIIAMAVAIALVINQVFEKFSLQKKILLIYLLLFVGIVAEFNFPIQLYKVPSINNFPKVYSWLATTSRNTSIIELPIYNWNTSTYAGNEIWREYYSTIEFRKMVNGYSGFSPPPWQIFVENMLMNFPSASTINSLRKMHITYIIVHTDEYNLLYEKKFKLNQKQTKNGHDILMQLKNISTVHLINQFSNTYVFKI